jgi:proteasome lid subunit RPN8/RPN11
MDDVYWIVQAKKYIQEHHSYSNVSEIIDKDGKKIIYCSVSVNLPSSYLEKGITRTGVKNLEEVKFIFPRNFPLVAPIIILRNDFPRNFPHINPSITEVVPCIYEGNLSELLQQSEWMNGILNQLVDWLEKAASNSLMNSKQGWEPMRFNIFKGFLIYNHYNILDAFKKDRDNNVLETEINYREYGSIIFAEHRSRLKSNAHIVFFRTQNINNMYIPNTIDNLNALYCWATSIGVLNARSSIEITDKAYPNEDKLFVVFLVKRPFDIIGTDSKIEFINFVISKLKSNKRKNKNKKRVLQNCNVEMLYHITTKSPLLMQKLSGINNPFINKETITFLGCGSLGSKMALHLARNGNDNFHFVDNDFFLPHNNARHGLYSMDFSNKSQCLAYSIQSLSFSKVNSSDTSAIDFDYSHSAIIIDTTVSFSVRNYLFKNNSLPQIISAGLYNNGKTGLLVYENRKKDVNLTQLWALLYLKAYNDKNLQNTLFDTKQDHISIGQSCSSQTMRTTDAQISLIAAAMSIKIQNILSNIESYNSGIVFYNYKNENLLTDNITIPNFIEITNDLNWNIYISHDVIKIMKEMMIMKYPNETGGILMGTVFQYPKKIVITKLVEAPEDSKEFPNLFVLGTQNLCMNIHNIESRTNGKVTYLGTWHSHPRGGRASSIDKATFEKLLFVRNYEPTVCLIITQNDLFLV